MKKRTIVSVGLAAVSVGLAILAYILLPETVVIQFSIGSSGNSTAPKLLAILIPTVLGVGGAGAFLFAKEDEKSSGKALLVSLVGIGVGILTIAVNSLMNIK